MEMTLREALARAGVLAPAMVDAEARGATYFAPREQTPEAISAFVTTLKTEAPHLFRPAAPGPGGTSEEIPSWLSPSEKLTRARAGQPPVVRQRPRPYEPTAEQLKSLEGKSASERLSAYRQWQVQAQGETS